MHKTYMDESGINDPLAMGIAGYFGVDTQLDRLAREWKAVLTKPEYGMGECGFHARKFYNPSPKDKVYHWPQPKRDQFIDELLTVIEDRRVWLFATSVDSGSFNKLSEDEKRHLTGGVIIGPSGKWKPLSGKASAPYFLALRNQLETVALRTPSGQKCYQILDWQEQYQGYAFKYYEWMTSDKSPMAKTYDLSRFGHPLVFGTRKQFPQLQAADLAAYHVYQFTLERISNPHVKPSKTFQRIVRKTQSFKDLRIVDCDSLPKLLERYREYATYWEQERKRRAARHGR